MSLYRIYIDETGNHDMIHADNPNQRFLALTGVILESNYIAENLQPEMSAIKYRFFQNDPDEPVIFHRKEMVNRRPPFEALRDPTIRMEFDQALLAALKQWEYHVITIVIDKKAHQDQYSTWHYHPYHYCLAVMLERFVLFLDQNNFRGDVMVESRGRKEDNKLKDSYRRLYLDGTDYIPAERLQDMLTSKELKVKPKNANIAGLQLADLIAHPAQRRVLIENNLLQANRDTFGDKICDIIYDDKYLRSNSGKISGFGTKLLP